VGPTGRKPKAADSVELHGHRFPIPGRHSYREGEGEFGAARPGRIHQGKDVWASCGSRLVAARGGRVARRGYDPRLYGHFLVIDARETRADHFYVHLAARSPAGEGERVRTGDFRFPEPPVNGRIPVWPVAVWDAARPPLKSLRRALRWDGMVPQVRGESPEDAEAGPDAIRELVAWIAEQRGADAGPFEVVTQGRLDADPGVARDQARTMADAGATWWIESWWDPATVTPEMLLEKVRQGPPRL
jgi:hypothetical protein